MAIPTELIGSIPRPVELMQAMLAFGSGSIGVDSLNDSKDAAIRATIERLEGTGSPILSDGEQSKPSFVSYPFEVLKNLAPDGIAIPFADGHHRRLPRLTAGPFRYGVFAGTYVKVARRFTKLPIKQAVISASALSLLYPAEAISGYSRAKFETDLLNEAEADIRSAFNEGATTVQIDFTEARLSLKLDPSGELLRNFVALNNKVLERFNAEEIANIGVHVCPGGDRDSTHSADVDYAGLLPDLLRMKAGRFYLQMASEPDRRRVLRLVRENMRPSQLIFVGVIDPINPEVETAELVRTRVLEAAEYLPLDQLGTTDDCGFSPFGDDMSTSREIAFAKIKARVDGTRLADLELGGRSLAQSVSNNRSMFQPEPA
jgi:5-methyltetrahydropteroyltriglutamate--homocysteine methyltransferase